MSAHMHAYCIPCFMNDYMEASLNSFIFEKENSDVFGGCVVLAGIFFNTQKCIWNDVPPRLHVFFLEIIMDKHLIIGTVVLTIASFSMRFSFSVRINVIRIFVLNICLNQSGGYWKLLFFHCVSTLIHDGFHANGIRLHGKLNLLEVQKRDLTPIKTIPLLSFLSFWSRKMDKVDKTNTFSHRNE